MTLTTRPAAGPPAPGTDSAGTDSGDSQERASESTLASSLSRLAAWIRHAPAERAPALGIPAVWTAAEIMHAAALSPVFTGAATLAAAGLAYGVGERRTRAESERDAAEPGTARPRLRGAELAAAAAGVGAWATAAAVWGPLAGPYDLISVLYGAGAIGGYWWLRSHEAVRATRARRDAAAAAEAEAAARAAEWLARRAQWHQLAARTGLQGSHLMAIDPNLNGETWTIDLYSTRKLASQLDCRQLAQRLAGELGVPRGRVEMTPDPEWVYRVLVLFRKGDPWKGGSTEAFIWHPFASGEYDPDAPFADLTPPQATIRDPVAIGADPESGTPLAFPLWDSQGAKRVLVVAASGQGKSMLLDDIRERITACADARLIQVNLSKGVEDSWWEPLAEASALASDPNPAAKARAILDFGDGVIRHRPAAAARKAGARVHEPTPGEPLFVLVVDEADAATADPGRKAALESIESKCRSEGWALILASQRPAGKWVSVSLRANLTHLVWSKMRASDARHASGTENFVLPDMGSYGGDNPGIFGVCQMPAHEDTPHLRGRTFFWGDNSEGLMRLIAARAATRPPYVLEPALAPLAGLWEAITGAAPLAGDDRYDLATTRDGRAVPGTAGVRGKLAAVARILDGPRPGPVRERPAADGQDEDQDGARDDPGADMPDEADRERLRAFLSGRDGTTVREAARALGLGRDKVWRQLKRWQSQGTVELRGLKATASWHAVAPGAPARDQHPYLRAVPDELASDGPGEGQP